MKTRLLNVLMLCGCLSAWSDSGFEIERVEINETVNLNPPRLETYTDSRQVKFGNALSGEDIQFASCVMTYRRSAISGTNWDKNRYSFRLYSGETLVAEVSESYNSDFGNGNHNYKDITHPLTVYEPELLVPGAEFTMEVKTTAGDYRNKIFWVKINVTWHVPSVNIPVQHLLEMKHHLLLHNIPLGDFNFDGIGSGSTKKKLVFSESASYFLYASVTPLPDENETLMQQKFATLWQWIKTHLQRNRPNAQVFDMDYLQRPSFGTTNSTYLQWVDLPEELSDNLFHWRYVQDLQGMTNPCGIILQTADESINYPSSVPPSERIWQDGSQCASDADILIAYSLWLAWQRGWGEEYHQELIPLLGDIKKKVILNFKAGELVNTETMRPKVSTGTWEGGSVRVNTMQPELLVTGNHFFIDFWQNEGTVLDFSHLTDLELTISSGIGCKVKLQDKNDQTVEVTVLPSVEYQICRLTKNDFQPSSSFDWSNVTDIILQYPNDQTSDSYIGCKKIQAILSEGQLHDNDGLIVTSNGHGDLAVNPSYFIVNAFRAFATCDDHEYWNEVIAQCYHLIEKSRHVVLHDKQGHEVLPNGSLIPNWLQINALTGELEDVYFQKPNNDIEGFVHSYDAFRTLAWLAMDYAQNQEVRAYSLLNQMGLFYRNELATNGMIYPEYKMNGDVRNSTYTHEPLGFALVHANMFSELGCLDEAETLLKNHYVQTRLTTNGTRYAVSEGEPLYNGGVDEYFLNFWSLFAGIFRHQTTTNTELDFDHDGKTDYEEILRGEKPFIKDCSPIHFKKKDGILNAVFSHLPNRKYTLSIYNNEQKAFEAYRTIEKLNSKLGDSVHAVEASVPMAARHAILKVNVEMTK